MNLQIMKDCAGTDPVLPTAGENRPWSKNLINLSKYSFISLTLLISVHYFVQSKLSILKIKINSRQTITHLTIINLKTTTL